MRQGAACELHGFVACSLPVVHGTPLCALMLLSKGLPPVAHMAAPAPCQRLTNPRPCLPCPPPPKTNSTLMVPLIVLAFAVPPVRLAWTARAADPTITRRRQKLKRFWQEAAGVLRRRVWVLSASGFGLWQFSFLAFSQYGPRVSGGRAVRRSNACAPLKCRALSNAPCPALPAAARPACAPRLCVGLPSSVYF